MQIYEHIFTNKKKDMELVDTKFYIESKKIALSVDHSKLMADSKIAWVITADITNMKNEDVISMILKARGMSSIVFGTKIFASFTENLHISNDEMDRIQLKDDLKRYYVDALWSSYELKPNDIQPEYHKERTQHILSPYEFLDAKFDEDEAEPHFNKRSVNYIVDMYIDGRKVLREPPTFMKKLIPRNTILFHLDIHWLLYFYVHLMMSWILWASPYHWIYGEVKKYREPRPIFQNHTNSRLPAVNIQCGRLGTPGDYMEAVASLPFMNYRICRFGFFIFILFYWTYSIYVISWAGSIWGLLSLLYVVTHAVLIYVIIKINYDPAWVWWYGLTSARRTNNYNGFFFKLQVIGGRCIGSMIYSIMLLIMMPMIAFYWVFQGPVTSSIVLLKRDHMIRNWGQYAQRA
jgi:hypothetical protein